MYPITVPSRRVAGIAVIIAVGYVVLAYIFDGLSVVTALVTIRPIAAYPVVVGLLFGPVAVFGAAIGQVITEVIRGTVGLPTLFAALGVFVFGTVSVALWGNLSSLSSGKAPELRSFPELLEFFVVILVAAVSSATVTGWGYGLIGHGPFYVVATRTAAVSFFSTLLFGPPVLFVLSRRFPSDTRTGGTTSTSPSSRESPHRTGPASRLAFVMIVWFAFGFGTSLGLRIFEAIPGPSLAKHTLPVLAARKDYLLWAGETAQVAVGIVAFSLLLRYCDILLGRYPTDDAG